MRSKISDLLEKINRLADPASNAQISKLEIDLWMKELRDLYEELDALRNSRPIANGIKKEDAALIQPAAIVPKKTRPAEEIFFHTELRTGNTQMDSTKKEVPPVKMAVNTKTSINENVQSAETLNSKLKSSSVKEVRHKLSTKPLKELIDLNKRFVMINELFGGNADDFSKAIHQIDSSGDFASADSFIRSSCFTEHKWDESSQTVKLFLGLVRQKFGVE